MILSLDDLLSIFLFNLLQGFAVGYTFSPINDHFPGYLSHTNLKNIHLPKNM